MPAIQLKADDWRTITESEPASLQDVMVSALDHSENEAVVFMAWRSSSEPEKWLISGSDEVLMLPVYAWAPVMEAAPLADALQGIAS